MESNWDREKDNKKGPFEVTFYRVPEGCKLGWQRIKERTLLAAGKSLARFWD